jgi:hypothetical protein
MGARAQLRAGLAVAPTSVEPRGAATGKGCPPLTALTDAPAPSYSLPPPQTPHDNPSDFINAFTTFLANCLVIYFLVVLPMHKLVARRAAAEEAAAPEPPLLHTRECPE